MILTSFEHMNNVCFSNMTEFVISLVLQHALTMQAGLVKKKTFSSHAVQASSVICQRCSRYWSQMPVDYCENVTQPRMFWGGGIFSVHLTIVIACSQARSHNLQRRDFLKLCC